MKAKIFGAALAGGLLGATMLTPSHAADLPSAKLAPVAPFSSFNPWMIRVRGLAVIPDDTSKVYTGAPYALVAGGKTNISNSFVPELDITYFFTPNFAAELILGVTPHNARGAGALAGLGKLGSAWLLPPTLTFQYHFTGLGAFKPYVGVGVNYTVFFSEKDAGLVRFRVKDSFGVALQVGFDYMIDKNWGFNFDVKKLFLRPEATGLLGVTPVKAKLNLDPWLVGVGVTYKF